MISYVVGRNLGHLSPCVAAVERLMIRGKERVSIYAFNHAHAWLKANLQHLERVAIKPLVKSKTFHDDTILEKSGLIFHDWREEVALLKQLRKNNRPIFGGMFHSDLNETPTDTLETLKFKRQIITTAEETTDIFFHINLYPPKEPPRLSNFYVPIPMVVRQPSVAKEEVKKRLGLSRDEPFILVVMGGGMGKYRYQFMDQWYDVINRLKLDERIVIANQLGGIDFAFNKRIKIAPLYANGMDLIHAADLVIAKPGMGILMDCIAAGKPLLALPADTKERAVKNQMLQEVTGTDICVLNAACPPRELKKRIAAVMADKKVIRKSFKRIPANGAEVLAQALQLLSGRTLADLKDVHQQILKLSPFAKGK